MSKLPIGALLFAILSSLPARAASLSPQAEIEAFNLKLEDATRRMDNADLISLSSENGISLLPSTKPLIGRHAISDFLAGVTVQLQGARMEKFEMKCSAIVVDRNWASSVLRASSRQQQNARDQPL
jgi:hypothetical protein